jgi:hypothetical protein
LVKRAYQFVTGGGQRTTSIAVEGRGLSSFAGAMLPGSATAEEDADWAFAATADFVGHGAIGLAVALALGCGCCCV